ncbi:MAG TPA: hypothetical protein VFI42_19825 [Thermomicrobiaceae bacterium]|nr:hypothetical protein [Thermomicrobiaceae bacterium]
MDRPKRSVSIVAALAVALMAATIAVALTAGSGSVSRFPPGSAEDVLQRYLQAVQNRDAQAAYGLLSADARRLMPESEFADRIGRGPIERQRIALRGIERDARGEGVSVTLAVTRPADPGLGIDSVSYTSTLGLVREDGGWRIEQPVVFF